MNYKNKHEIIDYCGKKDGRLTKKSIRNEQQNDNNQYRTKKSDNSTDLVYGTFVIINYGDGLKDVRLIASNKVRQSTVESTITENVLQTSSSESVSVVNQHYQQHNYSNNKINIITSSQTDSSETCNDIDHNTIKELQHDFKSSQIMSILADLNIDHLAKTFHQISPDASLIQATLFKHITPSARHRIINKLSESIIDFELIKKIISFYYNQITQTRKTNNYVSNSIDSDKSTAKSPIVCSKNHWQIRKDTASRTKSKNMFDQENSKPVNQSEFEKYSPIQNYDLQILLKSIFEELMANIVQLNSSIEILASNLLNYHTNRELKKLIVTNISIVQICNSIFHQCQHSITKMKTDKILLVKLNVRELGTDLMKNELQKYMINICKKQIDYVTCPILQEMETQVAKLSSIYLSTQNNSYDLVKSVVEDILTNETKLQLETNVTIHNIFDSIISLQGYNNVDLVYDINSLLSTLRNNLIMTTIVKQLTKACILQEQFRTHGLQLQTENYTKIIEKITTRNFTLETMTDNFMSKIENVLLQSNASIIREMAKKINLKYNNWIKKLTDLEIQQCVSKSITCESRTNLSINNYVKKAVNKITKKQFILIHCSIENHLDVSSRFVHSMGNINLIQCQILEKTIRKIVISAVRKQLVGGKFLEAIVKTAVAQNLKTNTCCDILLKKIATNLQVKEIQKQINVFAISTCLSSEYSKKECDDVINNFLKCLLNSRAQLAEQLKMLINMTMKSERHNKLEQLNCTSTCRDHNSQYNVQYCDSRSSSDFTCYFGTSEMNDTTLNAHRKNIDKSSTKLNKTNQPSRHTHKNKMFELLTENIHENQLDSYKYCLLTEQSSEHTGHQNLTTRQANDSVSTYIPPIQNSTFNFILDNEYSNASKDTLSSYASLLQNNHLILDNVKYVAVSASYSEITKKANLSGHRNEVVISDDTTCSTKFLENSEQLTLNPMSLDDSDDFSNVATETGLELEIGHNLTAEDDTTTEELSKLTTIHMNDLNVEKWLTPDELLDEIALDNNTTQMEQQFPFVKLEKISEQLLKGDSKEHQQIQNYNILTNATNSEIISVTESNKQQWHQQHQLNATCNNKLIICNKDDMSTTYHCSPSSDDKHWQEINTGVISISQDSDERELTEDIESIEQIIANPVDSKDSNAIFVEKRTVRSAVICEEANQITIATKNKNTCNHCKQKEQQ